MTYKTDLDVLAMHGLMRNDAMECWYYFTSNKNVVANGSHRGISLERTLLATHGGLVVPTSHAVTMQHGSSGAVHKGRL